MTNPARDFEPTDYGRLHREIPAELNNALRRIRLATSDGNYVRQDIASPDDIPDNDDKPPITPLD